MGVVDGAVGALPGAPRRQQGQQGPPGAGSGEGRLLAGAASLQLGDPTVSTTSRRKMAA